MYSEKRREDRDASEFTVALHLRNRDDEKSICDSFSGVVANMSSYGSCILLGKIREGANHLFYTPRDNASCGLFLEITGEGDAMLAIPVWPVWFDRLLWEDAKPFQVGVEFLLHPHDENIEKFKKLVKENQSKNGELKKLFDQCRTA